MANKGSNRIIRHEWSPSLSSIEALLDDKNECERDGTSSEQFLRPPTTRSNPCGSPARRNTSTTASQQPLRREQAGLYQQHQYQPRTTSLNATPLSRPVSLLNQHHSICEDDIFDMYEKKWDINDDENGIMGFFQSSPSRRLSVMNNGRMSISSRTSMMMRMSADERTNRASALKRMSWDFVTRTLEKKRMKRESQNITNSSGGSDWPLSMPNFRDEKMPLPDEELSSEKIPLPSPGAGPPLAAYDPNLVIWNGPNDPGNPMNWSRSRKWASTLALGFTTFCVTFASSVFSPSTEVAAKEFDTSIEVMILATALFVLGFAFGPIIWGPFSEIYGRKLPLFGGVAVFAIFQIPCALAPNLGSLLACRFLAGFFGCAPLSIVGGALADFWAPVDRGVAVSIFSGATFLGPTMGPIVGGYLTQTPGLGWRWTAWVTLFATMIFGTISWFVYPESFAPAILQKRARQRRFATKNWAVHAPADEMEISGYAILSKYISKPFLMLAYEPILLLMTIYISFIYGILYLFLETYPLVFHVQRGWGRGATGLPFIAVMVGVLLGGVVNFAFIKTRYVRILKQNGRVPPEERLVPMMVGAVALPAGLFLYAWTSDMESPWPQIMAGAPCGMGIVLIFLQGLNYIIDCYLMYSNSAIAGNIFIRSCFGAGFPVFALYLYRDLGVKWATSMLGFIALALMPVPVLFFIFGARLRKMSKFVPQLPPGTSAVVGGPPPTSSEKASVAAPPAQTSSPVVRAELPARRSYDAGMQLPPLTLDTASFTFRHCSVNYDGTPALSKPGTAIEMPPPAKR